jgi:hypothetical protein
MNVEGKRRGLDVRIQWDWYDWTLGVGVSYNRPADELLSGHVWFDVYVGPITVSACYYWWPGEEEMGT